MQKPISLKVSSYTIPQLQRIFLTCVHAPNIHSTGEVDEAQYPGGRYYAEVLELKKLTAYASDATVSKSSSIINNAHIFTNHYF